MWLAATTEMCTHNGDFNKFSAYYKIENYACYWINYSAPANQLFIPPDGFCSDLQQIIPLNFKKTTDLQRKNPENFFHCEEHLLVWQMWSVALCTVAYVRTNLTALSFT